MQREKQKIEDNQTVDNQWDEVSDFFALLLKIDARNNPYLYKKSYDRHSGINNTET